MDEAQKGHKYKRKSGIRIAAKIFGSKSILRVDHDRFKEPFSTASLLILIIGAIITLVFAALFGAEKTWWHTLMTSMMAILIVSILFVILQLAHPFTSGIAIKPDEYMNILEVIKKQ